MKLSAGKITLPGRKQVLRQRVEGRLTGDLVVREGEPGEGVPLLEPVMAGGRRLPGASPGLAAVRAHCLRELATLPAAAFAPGWRCPVAIGPALERETRRLAQTLAQAGGLEPRGEVAAAIADL
jgi:nicotinate phosphoribosyltransferase